MAILGLQTAKRHNNLRIIYLTLLMPFIVFLCILIYFLIVEAETTFQGIFTLSYMTVIYSLPVIWLWLFIAVYFQKQIIFKYTGSSELERKDNPELYNIVENLCISRGLPMPRIWIINDGSMNAFATGWSPKSSYVVFSKWLIEKLDKNEIEAVAWHELTHIINGDVRTMVIANVFIGIIWTVWYVLMRTGWWRSSSSKLKNPLPLLGLFLYIASIIFLPFINFAISRKKEFLADAGSVELTKDRDAMISALKKISGDSTIEEIQTRNSSVASMFIYDPKKKSKFSSKLKGLFSTHPSLEERIEMLQKY